MKKKLKLIREAEKIIGFKKFLVSKKSSESELDSVLSFIYTASIELEENFVIRIEELGF